MKNKKKPKIHREHDFCCQWQCIHCGAMAKEQSSIIVEEAINETKKTPYPIAKMDAEDKSLLALHKISESLLEKVNVKKKYVYLYKYLLSGTCETCGKKQPWILPKPLLWLAKLKNGLPRALGYLHALTINGGLHLLLPSLFLFSCFGIPVFLVSCIPLQIWQSIAKLRMAKAPSPLCQPNIIIEDLPELQQKQPDPKLTETYISRHRTFIEHDSPTWKCAACGTENLNSRGSCAKCGKYK